MTIAEIVHFLETIAPPQLQEDYDNAGLLTGNHQINCTGILLSLDCIEAVIDEAIQNDCNLIIAHHPIIFKGLKKINGHTYIERTIIKAIKNDIAIYAIHTNLDNVKNGVSGKMATLLGLQNQQILAPKKSILQKLVVFTPSHNADVLANALYAVGAGNIGNYKHCSFSSTGIGSFTPWVGSQPKVGALGVNEKVNETKLEVIFPQWLQASIIKTMKANHPYEEVAYDIINIENEYQDAGSGIVGELPKAVSETDFLTLLATIFKAKQIKHTHFTNKKIQKIGLCGGAGSFLIPKAKAAGVDAFVTADLKYHEFFDADGKLLLADTGHFESEQFTVDLLFELLSDKFPNFALLKTSINTNPVGYFVL